VVKTKKFRSLYAYLLVCMLCVLLPVQLIGGWLLLDSAQAVRSSAMQKSEQALRSAAEAVDGQIRTVYQRAQNYLVDRTASSHQVFERNDSAEPSKYWIRLRAIMNELVWVSRYNDLVLESRLYYPTLGFSISNHSFLPKEKVNWENVLTDASTLLRTQDDKLLVNVTYPSSSGAYGDLLILQTVTVSLPGLRELAESKVFGGSCLVYLNGECVAGPQEAMTYFQKNTPVHHMRVSLSGQKFYTFVHDDSDYGFALVNLVPADVLDASTAPLTALIAVYAVLSIALIVIYISFLGRSVHRPIRRLLHGFEKVRSGDLEVQIPPSGPGEFHQLTDGFNQMVQNLSEAIQTIYEQKVYTQQIEFKQLQAQINPHFLYNTFFMLERLVDDEDFDTSRATCRYLGEYFRYITYTGSQQTTLNAEFAHAMNYLNLQKLRYEGSLVADVDELPQSIAGCVVPRLIFQPILENAFAHGFDRSAACMRIRIHIETDGEEIRFVFENSASHAPQRALEMDLDSRIPEKETTGLMNIHRRIRLLYGEPYGLSLSQSGLGGLNVTLIVPARRK